MIWKTQTEPTSEPVSLTEAKAHCVVQISDDDAYITALVTAARVHIEKMCNRALVTRTIDAYWDRFPCECHLELPLGQLGTLTVFEWITSTGVTNTWTVSGGDLLDASSTVKAHIDSVREPAIIKLAAYSPGWPSDSLKTSNPIHARFTCGYGNAAAVPQPLRHAIMMLVAHWYENREAVTLGNTASSVSTPMSIAVADLIANYRLYC